MAGDSNQHSDLGYTDTLWKAADQLRGQVDAAEYKHVVLGLLFLKYISDSFETRRTQLKEELAKDGIAGSHLEKLLENRDEYTAERVFWVPPESRWDNLQNQAARPEVATLIDDAILAIERDNPRQLKNKLPRDYARRGIEPVKLKGLIDLIANIGFKGPRQQARDMLGRVYEYFLGKFAQAEGKLGGEFYTPRCIVRLLVEMLEPYDGRVYDPCCGSGGMFVQSEKFVEGHGDRRNVSIFGQESNPTTWRLAHMNLAIHGIEANLGEQPADTFLRSLHPDLKADYILANPPFNVSDWSGPLLREDARWRFGPPPVGNANYAWISHFIHHLAPPNGRGGGVAGFVMANGSLSSNTGGEGDIRRKIVEADLVDAIVAMPTQLFFTTGIPVCLWFLSRDKSGRNLPHKSPHRPGGRKGQTLFIDARKLGTMQTRTLRVLTGADNGATTLGDGQGDPLPNSDIGRITYAFRQWRGEPAPKWWDNKKDGEWTYRDTPGFCKAAATEDIAKHGFVLTPGRYVGAEELEEDGEPFAEKYARMVAEVEEGLAEGERRAASVRLHLAEVCQ
ncbi:MAG TPA: class I SAM-dependent DNA methyltransferase [Tepidisphaeraceae bacterium]|nr:class I SAM-dependent DNA methyltransferase [Tepidisphaeraceae bacterium]